MKYFIINRWCLLVLSLLGFYFGTAQNIAIVGGTQNFGTTDEITQTDRVIQVYNPSPIGIRINSIESFDVFGTKAFQVADTSVFLFPGDTVDLAVGFLPNHNIAYDQALIIRTSTGFGHIYTKLQGQGQYSNTYYQSTQNKVGEALRTALKSRIASGYNSLGYTAARDNMYASIDNVNGDVECVYTGRTAIFNTRSGANANNFNCEHTFPQGFFSQNEPMRSDIHHLFPTDVSSNSERGNDAFGVVSNASWSQGGSKSGGGKFEPRDVQKGATARAMMYFVLRYQDYTNFFQSQEALLYSWHQTYLPSAFEQQRNVDIAAVQNNRNPFVDYPQLMKRMSSVLSAADLDPRYDFYFFDDTIRLARGNMGNHIYTFLIYNHGDVPLKLFNWQLSDPTMSFSPFLNDTVQLLAGEIFELPLSFDMGTSYQNELLSFSNDYQGTTNFQVPIYSDADFATTETDVLDYKIFPNPAKDYLFIQGVENELISITLIDIWGKFRIIQRSGNGQFDISDLPVGIYMLRIKEGKPAVKVLIEN